MARRRGSTRKGTSQPNIAPYIQEWQIHDIIRYRRTWWVIILQHLSAMNSRIQVSPFSAARAGLILWKRVRERSSEVLGIKWLASHTDYCSLHREARCTWTPSRRSGTILLQTSDHVAAQLMRPTWKWTYISYYSISPANPNLSRDTMTGRSDSFSYRTRPLSSWCTSKTCKVIW